MLNLNHTARGFLLESNPAVMFQNAHDAPRLNEGILNVIGNSLLQLRATSAQSLRRNTLSFGVNHDEEWPPDHNNIGFSLAACIVWVRKASIADDRSNRKQAL